MKIDDCSVILKNKDIIVISSEDDVVYKTVIWTRDIKMTESTIEHDHKKRCQFTANANSAFEDKMNNMLSI